MNGGMAAALQLYPVSFQSRTTSVIHQRPCSALQRDRPLFFANSNIFLSGSQKFSRFNLSCKSTNNSGNNESRAILDAFFLGKAVGEAVSERIESAVGEFLSTVGRFQAEQQKQVQEFQEDVLRKAKKAKEMAAQEALDAQGQIYSAGTDVSNINGFTDTISDSVTTKGSSKPANVDLLADLLNED